jgi:iron complex outermembrane receptor protein
VGDPNLKMEIASSAEAILRGESGPFTFDASAYYTRFGNFIFDQRTGAIEDGLPVYVNRQANATWYGFEAQAKATLAKFGDWTLAADGLADWVHATIDGYGPAPRIPPLRVLAGLGLTSPKLDLRGEVERVTAQNRVAQNETATPGFTQVNAELSFRPWGVDRPISFALSANNIFNVDARRAASFLKDYAPLAGRDIRLSARLEL